jgi:hypothetical protein
MRSMDNRKGRLSLTLGLKVLVDLKEEGGFVESHGHVGVGAVRSRLESIWSPIFASGRVAQHPVFMLQSLSGWNGSSFPL